MQGASDTNTHFKFIVFDGPANANDPDLRRQVRSHVTQLQHRSSRQASASKRAHHRNTNRSEVDKAAKSTFRADQRKKTKPSVAQQKSKAGSLEDAEDTETESHGAHSRSLSLKTNDRSVIDDPPPSSGETDVPTVFQEETRARTVRLFPDSVLEKSFSRGVVAFRTITLADPTNVVGESLNRLQFDVSALLGCYDFILQVQAKDFERQYAPLIKPGTGRERFHRFIFTDPVLLATAIYITARYLLASMARPLHHKELYHLLQMQGFLVSSVNAALLHPTRSVSDQLLVTVALLAADQIKYGTRENYHIHMSGLVKMVNIRGGLPEIGRHDHYTERFIVWMDVNVSNLIGCPGYFQDVETSTMLSSPKPDPNMFRMKGYKPRYVTPPH